MILHPKESVKMRIPLFIESFDIYNGVFSRKEENIRVRVTPEQKQRLVEYAERHYQSMSGVVCQALDLLYAREEQQNNKE